VLRKPRLKRGFFAARKAQLHRESLNR
jgi:hypothetical protein